MNEEINTIVDEESKDELTLSIEEEVKKMERQAMHQGMKVTCGAILTMINQLVNKPGKISLNDYRRLIKDVVKFCNNTLDYTEDESESDTLQD